MFAEAEFKSERVMLGAGDYLVIYSDGVSEAKNMKEDMFEQARLSEALRGFGGTSVEELAETIRAKVREFTGGAPQADDITMVIVEYKGAAQHASAPA